MILRGLVANFNWAGVTVIPAGYAATPLPVRK